MARPCPLPSTRGPGGGPQPQLGPPASLLAGHEAPEETAGAEQHWYLLEKGHGHDEALPEGVAEGLREEEGDGVRV